MFLRGLFPLIPFVSFQIPLSNPLVVPTEAWTQDQLMQFQPRNKQGPRAQDPLQFILALQYILHILYMQPLFCLQLISWGQGAEFCLILILSSSTVNMGHMLHICLLSAHTPSFLRKSHKFPCPFHQHVCNLSHYGYRKLVLSSLRMRLALPSHLLLLWLPLE